MKLNKIRTLKLSAFDLNLLNDMTIQSLNNAFKNKKYLF